jgi:glycosyltransferase involved in cell wall biosynthesis
MESKAERAATPHDTVSISDQMKSQVYLNGRFFSQAITGVQRFATEVTASIDRLVEQGNWPESVVLTPRSPGTVALTDRSSFRRLRLSQVGRLRGHLWEQTELPVASRRGILVNLGNTAPVLSGSRQVVVIHDAGVFDTPESYSLKFRIWYKVLQRRLVDAGAHVVTVSKFARTRISECLGVDPEAIPIIYEGGDHILRGPAEMDILRRHGLSPGRFILMVGARAAHKNIDAISGLMPLLEERGIVVAIAGAMDPSVVFHPGSSARQIGRAIGRVSDPELRALYETATCLLFPSRYEGFGLPPVEAMACGCPVLASGSGAVREICGDAALYFSANDPESLTETLCRLLDDETTAADLRARGATRSATFRWDASALALADVIQTLQ